jgi:hypothetical protein
MESLTSFVPIDSPQFNTFFRENYVTDVNLYKDQVSSANCDRDPAASFEFQSQQKFVATYINDNTPYRGLLLWHGLGSGKTCSAINIANNTNLMRKTVVVNASLIDNFRQDYIFSCGYLKEDERFFKTKPDVKSDDNTIFNFITSNGVLNTFEDKQCINMFNESLIIIDESQILVSKITNAVNLVDKLAGKPPDDKNLVKARSNSFYQLYLCLRNLENIKIVCLSGTPIVDNPFELAILFNILHGDIVKWEVANPIKPLDDDINIYIFNKTDTTVYKCPIHFVNDKAKQGQVIKAGKSMTNEEFESLLKTYYSNVTRISTPLFNETKTEFNALSVDVIKNRIVGLTSYFSNIESLFPKVIIPEANRVDVNNRDKPMYSIKDMRLSPYQQELKTMINTIDKYTKVVKIHGGEKVFSNILSQSMIELKMNNPDIFAFPGLLEYLKSYDLNLLKTDNKIFIHHDARVTGKEKRMTLQAEDLEHRKRTAEWKFKPPTADELNLEAAQLKYSDSIFRPDYPYSDDEEFDGEEPEEPEEPKAYKYTGYVTEHKLSRIPEKPTDDTPHYVRGYANLFATTEYKSLSIIIQNLLTGATTRLLENDSLQVYSPKMYTIIQTISSNLDKLHIVYNEKLEFTIPFLRALQANGFIQNNYTPNTESKMKPLTAQKSTETKTKSKKKPEAEAASEQEPYEEGQKRYILYTGCSSDRPDVNARIDGYFNRHLFIKDKEGNCMDPETRTSQLNVFKKYDNRNGKYTQVIIINSAAAEGVSMKNIRYVHLLGLPPNMSKLYQIIGRGRRNCSHKDLQVEDRTITPILYLMPDENKKYNEMVESNNKSIPFYNMLIESSIDCSLSRARTENIDNVGYPKTCIGDPRVRGGRKHTKRILKKNKTTRKYKKRHYKKTRKYKKTTLKG